MKEYIKRKGLLQFAGQDVTVIGSDLEVGHSAPEFTVHAQDWGLVRGLESTAGKVRVLASLPSLDTSVCDRETLHFNLAAAALDPDIAILILSTDLPFAQKRWCGAAGVDQVTTLSDHMEVDFGKKYGVLIEEVRLLRRAVFVVNRLEQIVYAAYTPTLKDEPDYAQVLAAAQFGAGLKGRPAMTDLQLAEAPKRYRLPASEYTLVVDTYRWKMLARPHVWQPPADVYETEDEIVVRVEIAGIAEGDWEISLQGQILTLGGIRQDVADERPTVERRSYHQMEIPFGEFGLQIELPFPVAEDQVQAHYRDGFLKVFLPKLPPAHIHIS